MSHIDFHQNIGTMFIMVKGAMKEAFSETSCPVERLNLLKTVVSHIEEVVTLVGKEYNQEE